MSLYDIEVKDLKHNNVKLDMYKGKVLLIINTATKCGFTPQYKGLQALYAKYHDKGFEILDFPCNQFFAQAKGTVEEIHQFCELNYGIKFPQFDKIIVNGKEESPLYTYLKSQIKGKIKWNFTKFLIDRAGNVINRFEPNVKPEDIDSKIAELL